MAALRLVIRTVRFLVLRFVGDGLLAMAGESVLS